jgi:tRNA isopentenyl-2-thiomethyl-A-37 hydroxylase MiaE
MPESEPIKQKVTYIGKVDYRNKQLTFGIKDDDRTRHTYIIGKTGMGKSTLLENLIIQDINNGEGICVIDPHGSMAEKLLDHIPESRVKDVIYFAPFDGEHPLGLNVLEQVAPDKRHLVANGLMAAFKKLFQDQFSARMEYILNNIILALLENENQTLLGVNRMLTDKEYRKFIVSNVTDPTVKDFWTNEYANYTDRFAAEAAPAIQNKVGQFVSNPLIRNIIGQQKTSFDLREVMDTKKILIVNLSKGKVGESNANLIGSLLITKIYLAAMSRADAGPYQLEKLPPLYFYVDEFQNFANESFASILSEARKYNLALTVAHQYVEQMTDEVKAAVFGNVGTMIVFRVGATDAEIFEKEFAPYFILDDIVNLSAYQIYLRLMINGVGSKPFSAKTLDPIGRPAHSYAQAVIASSILRYSRAVADVEAEVAEFYKPMVKKETKEVKIIDGARGIHTKEMKPDVIFSEKKTSTRRQDEDRRPLRQDNRTPDYRREDPRRNERSRPNATERPYNNDSRRVDVRDDVEPKTFDDRPALSLKDALARALEPQAVQEKKVDTPLPQKKELELEHDIARKEVSEAILKKLIEEI